jgi:hypothetical protein
MPDKHCFTSRRLNAISKVRHKLNVSLPGSGSYNHSDIKVMLEYIEELEAKNIDHVNVRKDLSKRIDNLIKKYS